MPYSSNYIRRNTHHTCALLCRFTIFIFILSFQHRGAAHAIPPALPLPINGEVVFFLNRNRVSATLAFSVSSLSAYNSLTCAAYLCCILNNSCWPFLPASLWQKQPSRFLEGWCSLVVCKRFGEKHSFEKLKRIKGKKGTASAGAKN